MSRAVIITLSILLLVGLIGALTFGFVTKWSNNQEVEDDKIRATSKAVKAMCQPTDYKEACIKSLSRVQTDDPKELIKAAFIATKLELSNVTQNSTVLKELEKNPETAEAARICKELFQYAIDDLQRSFDEIGRMDWKHAQNMIGNLKSWLSASITYQDTCLDGFENTTGDAAGKVKKALQNSMQMSSNGLAIVTDMSSLIGNLETASLNRRRLLESRERTLGWFDEEMMGRTRRRLLEAVKLSSGSLKSKANVVVDKNGKGKYKTIGEALKEIPKNGSENFVIYIKEGEYGEHIKLEKWMTHVVFIGDGPTKTRIIDNKNLDDGAKTVKTATLSVLGDFFMAKDIGIANTAGAQKHQAVALIVQSDEAIFYNVHIDGYQDTLYVHTYRQFYRNCRISGSVDFVFGDAAAFFQNCTFVVQKPLDGQNCIITAHGRMERHQSTGIIIHQSRIEASPEYKSSKDKYKAFLGRPLKKYSRTVIMDTYIDDMIQSEGWMSKDNFGIDTCYFGEFNNKGPGSKLDKRVTWPGIKKMNDQRIHKFIPQRYFDSDAWIRETGVPYQPKLNATSTPVIEETSSDDEEISSIGAPDSSPSSEYSSSSYDNDTSQDSESSPSPDQDDPDRTSETSPSPNQDSKSSSSPNQDSESSSSPNQDSESSPGPEQESESSPSPDRESELSPSPDQESESSSSPNQESEPDSSSSPSPSSDDRELSELVRMSRGNKEEAAADDESDEPSETPLSPAH